MVHILLFVLMTVNVIIKHMVLQIKKKEEKSQAQCKGMCLLTCFVCVCSAVEADAAGSGTVST